MFYKKHVFTFCKFERFISFFKKASTGRCENDSGIEIIVGYAEVKLQYNNKLCI